MKTMNSKRIVLFSLGLFVGLVALGQILHDDSQAIGFCGNSCVCVSCGTAVAPAKACIDYKTFCRGPKLVRNCAEYCTNRWGGLVPLPEAE